MAEEQKSKDAPKSQFELSVDLVKALAWPVLSLIVLIGFFGPLRSIAKQLPDILNRSNVISIGGLSLEVGRNIQAKASPKVEEVLKELSSESINTLLNVEFGIAYRDPTDYSINSYSQLVELGLMRERSEEELEEEGFGNTYGVSITPLGTETREFLLAIVEELIQEIQLAEEEN